MPTDSNYAVGFFTIGGGLLGLSFLLAQKKPKTAAAIQGMIFFAGTMFSLYNVGQTNRTLELLTV